MPRIPHRLCTCGAALPYLRMRKHVLASPREEKHCDVEWLLGHLIIRDDPNDAARRAELQTKIDKHREVYK